MSWLKYIRNCTEIHNAQELCSSAENREQPASVIANFRRTWFGIERMQSILLHLFSSRYTNKKLLILLTKNISFFVD